MSYIGADGTTYYNPILQTQGLNEIWYTSTDGKPIDIDPQAFDLLSDSGSSSDQCLIVENTYKNGLGIIKTSNPIKRINEGGMVSDTLKSVKLPDDISLIDQDAFSVCSGLTSVELGSGLVDIGREAFLGCEALTSIKIPDGVKFIREGAFNLCSGLTSVELGSGVTSIGDSAFRNCSGLTSLKIPDGVTEINQFIASDCTSLENIELGSGVTSIGDYAFTGSDKLTNITINALTPPSLDSDGFHDISSSAVFYVPAESVKAYKTATGWSKHAGKIQAIA